jgi:hypothetical protein
VFETAPIERIVITAPLRRRVAVASQAADERGQPQESTMARYRMDDGTIIDTEKAAQNWNETTDWDGRNHISRPTGGQWAHQRLYKSKKGRYYVEHSSDYQGSREHVEWVSPEEAARWLLLNEHELPEDLKVYAEEIAE